jgi:hypothetical protein
MLNRIRRHRIITGTVAALVVVAAVSVAAILLTGQKGPGRSHFRQLQNITVAAGTAPTTGPYGVAGSDGDVAVKLSNPNSVPLKVISVQRDASGGPITSIDTTGCNALDPNLSVNAVTLTAAQQTAATLPAGATNVNVELPNVIHVVTAPTAACMAADFNVPLDLTVQAG